MTPASASPTTDAESAAPKARPGDLWLTEQIEALAVAVAMALVLKFFVIEAYQIPSGSMQPNILGDAETGIHDRVIADKLCTMLRDPKRWEVMIFRFPNDERRLYVKRIVGLPGERLEVRGGDIWVNGAIARKPDHVNDSVLKDIFPEYDGALDLGRAFTVEGDVEVSGQRAVFPVIGPAELRLRKPVTARYLHGYDPDWGIADAGDGTEAVSDLELSLKVRLDPGALGLRLVFSGDDGDRILFLPAVGGQRDFRIEHRPYLKLARFYVEDPERTLPVDTDIAVVARVIDRQILVLVDGEEWARIDEDHLPPKGEQPERAGVSISVAGGGSVSDVNVRRDIFYLAVGLPEARWQIPTDHYFGMGDNTQSSLDSRRFARRVYTLKDGRQIAGFDFGAHRPDRPRPPDANPVTLPDGTLLFADAHGDVHRIDPDEIEPVIGPDGRPRDYAVEPAPFIHERYLLGKVLAVFWPIASPNRWKFVR